MRVIDIIDDCKFIELAAVMGSINFQYLQKSEVHLITGPTMVIVANQEGKTLSEFATDLPGPINEVLLRAIARELLTAILYLASNFRIDFHFSANDVLVLEPSNSDHKHKFKLRNTFIQKSDFNELKFYPSKKGLAVGSDKLQYPPEVKSTIVPCKAIRSLGMLLLSLAKNRFGFKLGLSYVNCPWISKELNEVIESMASFNSFFSPRPEQYFKKLMTAMEMKLERGKIAHQTLCSGSRRTRDTQSAQVKRNSNPF